VITHQFRSCLFRVFPETQYVDTVFSPGLDAGATRECSEVGNASYAKHLGYSDCWTALISHEFAHTFLSEKLGRFFSPTLWAVANNYSEGTAPYEERLAEEAEVLSFERWVNRGELLAVLQRPEIAPHLYAWKEEYRRLLIPLLPPCLTVDHH
jgi:hypothetical protein